MQYTDPFETFRAKREIEKLEKRVRSNPTLKCPTDADAKKGTSPARPAFDPERSWIY